MLTSAFSSFFEWQRHDVDSLAHLYDTGLLAVLDRLVPQRTVTCRRRSSDPWFDDECRQAKRRTRRLERASSRAARAATTDPSAANVAAAAAAVTAWTTERRVYRNLQNRKRE